MRNEEIIEIRMEEIFETLDTKPQILLDNDIGKCYSYLKNFDYHYVFCIIDPSAQLHRVIIKLPKEFVEEHDGENNYRKLLDEFLKITGTNSINERGKKIVRIC